MKSPFPYFGGKRRAAGMIWDALGDVGGYVEPFCGSAAVLLARPAFAGRRVETIGRSSGGSGYNNNGRAGRRERLWLSPTCVESQYQLLDLPMEMV